MENAQYASIFEEIADLLELQEANEFRVRSYQSAARTIRGLSQRLEDLIEQGEDLSTLPNVGKSTAEKIEEIHEKGTCQRLEELRGQFPEELTQVMKVPQLGSRKAMLLHEKLGIKNLDDLKKACENHKVQELPNMGEKTEQNILDGIATLESTSGRFLYKEAAEYVESIKRMLKKIKAVKQWQVAGSFRRGKETVGDLDILVQAEDRSEATKQIQQYEAIKEVISKGKERVSVVLDNNLQIDFRFFEPEAFGSAQLYFTGSKAHNIAVRKRAVKNDWKLNEYGLFKDDKRLAGKTEESVYKRVKMDWIPPELREDRGEVEAAEQGKLPRLIELKDVRGDLHAHTKASDGLNTIEEMADAARERDYEYLAITDHSKAVSVAQGLDEKRLKNHARDVRKISDSYKDLWLLAGIEVDILKSGKLDLDEKALGELDWVVASIHSYFDLDEKKMTDRLLSAVESGVVHCLGHPTGRMIGKRQSIPFDTEKVFKACAENNVALGINAQPERLDLPDTFCQQARELGVVFAISTDAHKIAELDFIAMGVSVARRGWLEKKHVLNTWTPNKLEKFIQRK